MNSLFTADVISWDSAVIHVLCPVCEGVHRHRMSPSSLYERQRRAPDCGELKTKYELRFPFDLNTKRVAYEIDKNAKRYVTVGIAMKQEEEEEDEDEQTEVDDDATIASETDKRLQLSDRDSDSWLRFEDGVEMKDFNSETSSGERETWQANALEIALSDCIFGDILALRNFLSGTKKLDYFLHGKDEEGNTVLTYAAAERYPAILGLLLSHGASRSIDSRNCKGRTPLMEAALWGRLKNAKLLLQHGADPGICDRRGRKAVDFARQHPRNDQERQRRVPWYVEDHHVAELQRRRIVLLLDYDQPSSGLSTLLASSPSETYESHHFHHIGDTKIVLSAPIATFPIQRRSKTIATLERGLPFASIAAMSGWSHEESPLDANKPSSFTTISGKSWTEEVFAIAKFVGHHLKPDPVCDHGKPGFFSACHAEKELVAWFLHHHVFLPDELESDAVIRQKWNDLDDSLAKGLFTTASCQSASAGIKESAKKSLWDIHQVQPPISLVKVTILSSTPICTDCCQFMRSVESAFGICIDARYC